MPTAAQLFLQKLNPLAVGEDADQTFVGRFPTNLSGATFKYTLTASVGAEPALELVSPAEVGVASVASGSEFIVTFTVHYLRVGATLKNTLDLTGGPPGNEKLYAFDLWRTDAGANARLAAGIQPVVTPARDTP